MIIYLILNSNLHLISALKSCTSQKLAVGSTLPTLFPHLKQQMETPDGNTFTLRGSTEIVTEFFQYSVNNILYQRGIYPPETFQRIPKYGLAIFVSTDEAVGAYLNNIVTQLRGKERRISVLSKCFECISLVEWLLRKNVQKLILVIKGLETISVLERWVFDCEVDRSSDENMSGCVKSFYAGLCPTYMYLLVLTTIIIINSSNF